MKLEILNIYIENGSFINIIGNVNSFNIESFFKNKDMTFVVNKYLNIFNGETVEDEIAFGLENKGIKKELMKKIVKDYSRKFNLTELLIRDPFSLGTSDKAKLKICSALICRSKIFVLNDILSLLDKNDYEIVIKLLKEYVSIGGIILNFTTNIEETLLGDRIIIVNDNKVVVDGETFSVLNEEKILKRLGLGLPFYIELSKYLIDYNLIKKYYTDSESLVNALWK